MGESLGRFSSNFPEALPLVIGYGCYGDSIEEDGIEGEDRG